MDSNPMPHTRRPETQMDDTAEYVALHTLHRFVRGSDPICAPNLQIHNK
jgi:hypothetical protein